MQKKLFSSILMVLTGTLALTAMAETKGTSSGPVTPTSPPPMSQQQFKSEVDKAVKANAENLNNQVQQIQKQGPGALIQPETMRDPNAVDSDQNTSSSQTTPQAAPKEPAVTKPATKPLPTAPAATTPAQSDASAPADSGPAPYSGYGTSKPSDTSGGNNNSKSNSWNMGY